MDLCGAGVCFRLGVLDYEFEGNTCPYDSEWLIVRVSVDGASESWQSFGLFLRIIELKGFLGWLRSLMSPGMT